MNIETLQLKDDRALEVFIRRHSQAKRATLRVDAMRERLLITLPPRASEKIAWDLIKQAHSWIEKQLERTVLPIPFTSGAQIPVFGTLHDIDFYPHSHPKLEQDISAKKLSVYGIDAKVVPTIVVDWLWQELQDYTLDKVYGIAKAIGQSVNRIQVKDMKSRWGSCSSRGNISLSWRLVFAPHDVVDYVCAHEVSHLVEMNHSPGFWDLVAKTCPDYKKHRTWLRQNSKRLQSYGVSV